MPLNWRVWCVGVCLPMCGLLRILVDVLCWCVRPSNVRSRSGQPCSLCRAVDLCVLRPARRIHIRLRGRVLHNSPPPASVRSALAPTVTALGTLGSSARCSVARTCLTAHPTNRVVACRSVRHSPPRPLPHLPQGAFFFASPAAARHNCRAALVSPHGLPTPRRRLP